MVPPEASLSLETRRAGATERKGARVTNTIDPNWLPDESQPDDGDEEKAGEVPTSFATKGLGWSGREDDSDGDPLE